jgi:O-antigen/teichoic acid export membrane protein
MKGRHYLLKVLGVSSAPKLITLVLTLTAFPLMVRAIGASEYGIVVYLTSIVVMFDALVAGVVAAAGKAIAAARVEQPALVRAEFARWFRLQVGVSLGGLALALGVGGAVISVGGRGPDELMLYLVLAVTSCVAIAATFVRIGLTSLLAFGQAAIIDSVESVLRSATWLFVAFVVPSVTALVIGGLVAALLVLALAVAVLRSVLRARHGVDTEGQPVVALRLPVTREMVRESLQFFSVNFATRAFQSFPLILIDHRLGSEVVGILGAFGRILEMISYPFTVIAGAMAVRAHETRARGVAAMREYWNIMVRTAVLAFALGGALFFVSAELARAVLPDSANAVQLFAVLAVLFVARSVADLFASASDYVGGLGKRIVFLAACAVLQLPFIWVGAAVFGDVGAVTSVVGTYVAMVVGYVFIAKRAFFGRDSVALPRDVALALLTVASVVTVCWIVRSALELPGAPEMASSVITLGAYVVSLGTLFVALPTLKRIYPNLRFLDFK